MRVYTPHKTAAHHKANAAVAESVDNPIELPIIDFADLQGDENTRRSAAAELDQGFQTYGFVYLANHGIPQEMVDEAFYWAGRYFEIPLDIKLLARRPDNRPSLKYNRGYVPEKTDYDLSEFLATERTGGFELSPPERKETFEMGNPSLDEDRPNYWATHHELPGFKEFQYRWWKMCIALQQKLLGVLGEALGLRDAKLLRKQEAHNDSHMTIAHYPNMRLTPLKSRQQRWFNPHTNMGGLTLMFQNEVGGLEVHNDNVFKPVRPILGTILLSVGEMLERQTNGRWKCALQQVALPDLHTLEHGFKPNSDVVDRFSIAYHGMPDPGIRIYPLPECPDGKWMPNLGDSPCPHDSPTSYELQDKRLKEERYGPGGFKPRELCGCDGYYIV
ncbi:hypothetical protein BGZ61DRAFT_353497 [Ilyonectria robusta]|uniref:uncharacterized protein n=1 Tax=Ilyonectria robusta TaxID=1079257 RepID=UPI001E8DF852|nr:uncharacterized protein BGZ61DRAFT_353497 [Ilyonectria robusta]KAH8688347.1 hypothetical protein BGZ61DRAFT_353497 [Ilyonectria robusta]